MDRTSVAGLMPKSLMWPDPLPPGTPVVVTRGVRKGIRGVIVDSQRWDRSIGYTVEMTQDGGGVAVGAGSLRPLDLTDPEDLEVWLDE